MDHGISLSVSDKKAEALWQNFEDDNDSFWEAYEQLLEEVKPVAVYRVIAVASPVEIPQQITSAIDFKGNFSYAFFVPENRKKQLLDNYRKETTKKQLFKAMLPGGILAVILYPVSLYISIIAFLACLGWYLWEGEQAFDKQKEKLNIFFGLTPTNMTIAGRQVPLYNITRMVKNKHGFHLYKDVIIRSHLGSKTKYVRAAFIPAEVENYDELRIFLEVKIGEHKKYVGYPASTRADWTGHLEREWQKQQRVAQQTKPTKPTKRKKKQKVKPTQVKSIKQNNPQPKAKKSGSAKS